MSQAAAYMQSVSQAWQALPIAPQQQQQPSGVELPGIASEYVFGASLESYRVLTVPHDGNCHTIEDCLERVHY